MIRNSPILTFFEFRRFRDGHCDFTKGISKEIEPSENIDFIELVITKTEWNKHLAGNYNGKGDKANWKIVPIVQQLVAVASFVLA